MFKKIYTSFKEFLSGDEDESAMKILRDIRFYVKVIMFLLSFLIGILL